MARRAPRLDDHAALHRRPFLDHQRGGHHHQRGPRGAPAVTISGCDYSWDHPAPAVLAAAGKAFAGRYLPWDRAPGSSLGAFLTGAERDALHDAGIAIVALYEREASRASTAGSQGGLLDGTDARSAMSALGFPVGRTVYVTVQDTTTVNEAVIATYFGGFLNGLGPKYRAGIYAGSVVRNYLAAHGFPGVPFWQAAALSWSGGRWDPTATIQQRGVGNIAGTDADTALVVDYGQWDAPQLPSTDTEVQVSIYTLGGMRTGVVAAGTPYYTNPGDPAPRSTITATQRYLLTAYDASGGWIALDGKYLQPTGTTPQMCGWVKASAVTAIEPVTRPYHVDLEVTSSAAPVVTVTQA